MKAWSSSLLARKEICCFAIFFLSTMAACGGGGGSDNGGSDSGGPSNSQYSVFSVSGTSDSSGTARIGFDIPADVSKFSVQVDIPRGAARVDSVSNAGGNEYAAPGGAFLSLAQEFNSDQSFLSVPSRDFDPTVQGPDSFTAVLTTAGSAVGGHRGGLPVTLTITTSTDSNLSSGNLVMNIFYVGGIGQSAQTKQAVQAAMEHVKDIYGAAGITVSAVERDLDGPSILPDPTSGSDFYSSGSAIAGGPATYQFIGGDVDTSIGADVFGITGSIPGSPNPSRYSAVAVSIVNSAGPDGVFDDVEIRILAETIAHETGHYLGLFHPVEISDFNSVVGEDPLSDTPSCSSINDCLGDASLIHNLMFPFPVQDTDGSYVTQDELTNQQGGVMNRHVAVN